MVSRSHAPSEPPRDLPPPPRAMSHRAPSIAPSTTSSRTLRRHHRGSRSHSGGTNYRPQNEFPNFAQTGDVEIVIAADGQERRYILHRLILSQCSGFFEASTSEEWSRQNGAGLGRIGEDDHDDLPVHTGSSTARNAQRVGDGKIRWRYELDWGDDEDIPMLVRKPLQPPSLFGSSSSHSPQPPPPPPSKPSSFLRNMTHNFSTTTVQTSSSYHPTNAHPPPPTTITTDSETLQDYDNLLRTFYNHPPTLHPSNIAEAYIQCKTLLHLADMYDALPIVGPRIDHHLLQFQGRLWKQIAKYPPSYLKLGYLARSKVIFAEALVHVVGAWPSGRGQLTRGGGVPEAVMEVVEDKVDELAERRMVVEARLFRITLTTSKGDRVTPQNAYVDWLALSLFRSWLTDTIGGVPTIVPSVSAGAGGAVPSAATSSTLYRKLGQGGSAYLGHDECKKFLRLSRPEDHGRDTLKRFERKMDEIKGMAREAVRPLMKHNLELDAGGGGLGYLTCTKVEEEDYPWD